MSFDFDRIINRDRTACEKWDPQYLQERFGVTDLISMWVADLDFQSPPTVIEALKNRVEHGVYGYTFRDADYFKAVVNWISKRYGWKVQSEWILHSPGVVPALAVLIRALTKENDKIVIQSPVYHHFAKAIKSSGRTVMDCPLTYTGDTYVIDYTEFEKSIAGAKLFILCNPHNPVGRVWTKDELTKIGEICLKHNVIVLADEIHCDVIYKPYKFTSFASILPEFSNNSVTCMAPSKTFNLQGLQMSTIIIPNEEIRNKYETLLNSLTLGNPNVFGLVALESAYRTGEPWLEALISYLHENIQYTLKFFAEKIPEIKISRPEGTYMLWLDCNGLGMTAEQLEKFMLYEAKIAMNEGHIFGENGKGFMRMNIGCSRAILEKAFNQLYHSINNRR